MREGCWQTGMNGVAGPWDQVTGSLTSYTEFQRTFEPKKHNRPSKTAYKVCKPHPVFLLDRTSFT
jgi:hypothetical protein